MSLRPDLQIIFDWIPAGAHILDLGSGDGTLLAALQQHDVTGYGLEIDNSQIAHCIESGINVIQADLDQGLPQFADQSFDYVILSTRRNHPRRQASHHWFPQLRPLAMPTTTRFWRPHAHFQNLAKPLV